VPSAGATAWPGELDDESSADADAAGRPAWLDASGDPADARCSEPWGPVRSDLDDDRPDVEADFGPGTVSPVEEPSARSSPVSLPDSAVAASPGRAAPPACVLPADAPVVDVTFTCIIAATRSRSVEEPARLPSDGVAVLADGDMSGTGAPIDAASPVPEPAPAWPVPPSGAVDPPGDVAESVAGDAPACPSTPASDAPCVDEALVSAAAVLACDGVSDPICLPAGSRVA
jgi:hypothetical protein